MLKSKLSGFPGGAVVESPPADAGDTRSCPGLGRSRMPWSGWAREPRPLSLRVRSLCSTTGEATTVRGSRTAKKKKKTTSLQWSTKSRVIGPVTSAVSFSSAFSLHSLHYSHEDFLTVPYTYLSCYCCFRCGLLPGESQPILQHL